MPVCTQIPSKFRPATEHDRSSCKWYICVRRSGNSTCASGNLPRRPGDRENSILQSRELQLGIKNTLNYSRDPAACPISRAIRLFRPIAIAKLIRHYRKSRKINISIFLDPEDPTGWHRSRCCIIYYYYHIRTCYTPSKHVMMEFSKNDHRDCKIASCTHHRLPVQKFKANEITKLKKIFFWLTSGGHPQHEIC